MKTLRLSIFALVLATAAPVIGQMFKVETVANPTGSDSLQANWSVTPAGDPLLSWVETGKDSASSLRYAVRRDNAWTQPRTVTTKRQFFRHPAELPEVIALTGGTFLAHWIETPEGADDAEYVYVSASKDGMHWTAPAMVNKDRSPVQHGLASMIESGNGEASIFWLQALKGEDGPVSLMRSIVNTDGRLLKEENLDSDVCACCPTSAVKTGRGLLVAYRDRTPDNIRDIAVMRLENGRWLPSKNVYPDKWRIDACPTNAAVAAAKGDRLAIAWYTAAGDSPRVEVAFSADAGTTFTKPSVISVARAYGYASTVLDDDGSAIASWLEQGGGAARLMVRRVPANGVAGAATQIAQGSRMDLGYPRLLHAGNETWITWGNAKVQTARLSK